LRLQRVACAGFKIGAFEHARTTCLKVIRRTSLLRHRLPQASQVALAVIRRVLVEVRCWPVLQVLQGDARAAQS
jgi:hypothetical protein